MAALAFLLECAAVAAAVGVLASLLVVGGFMLPWPALRLRPALRADGAFVLGTLPAVVSLAVVAAAAAPSLSAVLGWSHDHCGSHGHHLHLCILHSSGLRPVLAVVGAVALAVFIFRAGGLVWRVIRTRARLAALGSSRPGMFPVVAVPGAPRLCHAAGVLHRRIRHRRSGAARNPDAPKLSGAPWTAGPRGSWRYLTSRRCTPLRR